jgi:hypothetical protein
MSDTYKSDDLGGHILTIRSVFNYADDCSNLLVLTDDHADGLVYVYYGNDRAAAELAIQKAIGSDLDQIRSEVTEYLDDWFDTRPSYMK